MSEVENPVITVLRLIESRIRVVKDDGGLARILCSQANYDRELLKDYEINILHEGTVRWHKQVRDNHQRLNVLNLPEAVTADEVQILITATNGAPDAHIFEVRIY